MVNRLLLVLLLTVGMANSVCAVIPLSDAEVAQVRGGFPVHECWSGSCDNIPCPYGDNDYCTSTVSSTMRCSPGTTRLCPALECTPGENCKKKCETIGTSDCGKVYVGYLTCSYGYPIGWCTGGTLTDIDCAGHGGCIDYGL